MKEAFPPAILTDLPLLNVDDRGLPMQALAKTWQTSDRQTWTLTLHENLVAHDGTPLTASRIRTALLERSAKNAAFNPVAHDLVSIDIPNPVTLIIRLRRPTSAFPEAIRMLGIATTGNPALSAGPFRLVRDSQTKMDLEPFQGSPGEPRPEISGLTVSFYPTSRAAWAAFLRNEADFLYEVPPAGATLLAQNPDVELYEAGGRHLYTLGFQHEHGLLRDVRVRQAINLAVDRDDIARRVFAGYTKPGPAPFTPYYWAVEGLKPSWEYDPDHALKLLEAATKDGDDSIELVCITSRQFPLVADVAAAVEAQLARVKIRLRLVPLDREPLYARLQSGDFDLFVMPMLVGYGNLWPYIFWHSSTPRPFARTGYNAADSALDRLYTAASPDAEQTAARAVVDVMRQDPPAAFLVPVPVIRAVRRTWRVPPATPALRDIRRTLSRWSLASTTPCAPS